MNDLVAVYADESCLGNGREGDNPGGAGGLVEYRRADGSIVRRDFWISEPSTTNNRMALRSVIEAFLGLSRKQSGLRVVFTSDSKYLITGLGEWVHGWARRGWTRKGGSIENLGLWQQAVRTIEESGHAYEWRWVRGHAGHPQNEYANHLATRAAAQQSDSGGFVPSHFVEWCAARRGTPPEPAPFPESNEFVASPRMPRGGMAVASRVMGEP